MNNKQKILVTVVCSVITIIFSLLVHEISCIHSHDRVVTAGFIYMGDEADSYTANFVKAQRELEKLYDEQINVVARFNVPLDMAEEVMNELCQAQCDIIFVTSEAYCEISEKISQKYADVQICQVASSNTDADLSSNNYHTFSGRISEGRYIAGAAAGLKLKELIDNGTITVDEARIGFLGAYPLPEVTSGYNAFLMGVQSVVPEAVMTVKFTNSWSSYHLEKLKTQELIDEGCIIISHQTDTSAPAAACEETDASQHIFLISYNESMRDIAPTTYLTGTRINWLPYVLGAVEAIYANRDIEHCVKGDTDGNNICGGIDRDWVQVLDINEFSAAEGTDELVAELSRKLKRHKLSIICDDSEELADCIFISTD